MDVNRNQYFLAGLVVLFFGLQIRFVDSYVLTPEFTQILAERTGHPLAAVNAATAAITPSQTPMAKKTVRPPEFVGWALLSFGSVLILHALSMKRPE